MIAQNGEFGRYANADHRRNRGEGDYGSPSPSLTEQQADTDRDQPHRRATPEAPLVDDGHLMRGLVQPTSAVGGDGHDVLDPDAEPVREVDAGFDGEAHTRLQ